MDIPKTIWSANALIVDPEAVVRVHTEFIQAGARIITTCSYGTAAANAITQKRSAGERARRQIPLAAATATAYVRSVCQTGAALRSVSQSRAQRSGARNAMRRIGFAGAFGPIGVAACHAMPCHAISRVRCHAAACTRNFLSHGNVADRQVELIKIATQLAQKARDQSPHKEHV